MESRQVEHRWLQFKIKTRNLVDSKRSGSRTDSWRTLMCLETHQECSSLRLLLNMYLLDWGRKKKTTISFRGQKKRCRTTKRKSCHLRWTLTRQVLRSQDLFFVSHSTFTVVMLTFTPKSWVTTAIECKSTVGHQWLKTMMIMTTTGTTDIIAEQWAHLHHDS